MYEVNLILVVKSWIVWLSPVRPYSGNLLRPGLIIGHFNIQLNSSELSRSGFDTFFQMKRS